MVFDGRSDRRAADAHAGYVAGRYRDGGWSDDWTDVRRCAEATFTAYAPACVCGWRGPAAPATAEGHLSCQRMWVLEHVGDAAVVVSGRPNSTAVDVTTLRSCRLLT